MSSHGSRLSAVSILALAFFAQRPDSDAETPGTPLVRTHRAMATEFTITLYPRSGEHVEQLAQLVDDVFEDLDQFEALISEWKPDSLTSRVNEHAAEAPVRVTPDWLALVASCRDLSRRTEGAFDITVGPLSELYGFYKKQGHVPSSAELTEALAKVGMAMVTLDRKSSTVAFAKRGMRLDFGGVGKGAAVDRAARILKARGVTRALIDGGTSSLYAIGAPPGEPGWKVRIRHPYTEGQAVAEVTLRDESLSTSGCYGNLPVVDGVRICNIFDPRTGQPRHGIVSASAIAPTGTETEAFGKAFLVLGVDETRRLCEKNRGLRAIIVQEAPGEEVKPIRIGFDTGPQDQGVHHEP